MNKTGNGKKAEKDKTITCVPSAALSVAATVAEKPSNNGNAITLEQIKKVAQTVKSIGGFQRMTEVLDVIKESGGVKKFRELAEAMTVPEGDVVAL